MNRTSILISTLLLFILSLSRLQAQDNASTGKTSISIETDPSTFAFNGYALHVRINPKNSKFQLGAGLYALDFPSLLVDINKENKDKGWQVRINSAYSLFGEYYLGEANHKWFIGLQAGIQNFKNTNSNMEGLQSRYSNLILMPSVGYSWHPFKFPIYFKPWLGMGYTTKVASNNSIGTYKYNISPLVPFATLHVGYTIF